MYEQSPQERQMERYAYILDPERYIYKNRHCPFCGQELNADVEVYHRGTEIIGCEYCMEQDYFDEYADKYLVGEWLEAVEDIEEMRGYND